MTARSQSKAPVRCVKWKCVQEVALAFFGLFVFLFFFNYYFFVALLISSYSEKEAKTEVVN